LQIKAADGLLKMKSGASGALLYAPSPLSSALGAKIQGLRRIVLLLLQINRA
jgi:hypothetical protein